MKNLLKTVLLIFALTITTNINAQSTERFIRIIGNSKKEIKANKSRIYFSISEVAENQYKKTESKTYDKVYNEFISKLTEIGFKEKDLNTSYKKINNYNRVKSKNFFIDLNINSIEKINSIKINGFQITGIKYLITNIDKNLETKLSLEAINDATRKANAICNKVNKKLGKILNIEVKPNDFESNSKELNDIIIIKTYKISITFKLND